MLKSKSSFTLEKPKQSEGWIKIQEWDRRWNKVLSIVFGVLSFMLLFAIVLANTMSTAAVLPPPVAVPNITTTTEATTTDFPSTSETTDLSTTDNGNTTISEDTTMATVGKESLSVVHHPFDIFIFDFCFIRFCNATCTNGRIGRLSNTIEVLRRETGCNEMNLEINRCNFPNGTIYKNWLMTSASISVLKLTNSYIRTIDRNAFTGSCFKNLRTLVLKNLDITKMFSKCTFKGLGNLRRLEMKNLPLRYFRNDVFAPFARRLDILVFEEMSIMNFPVQNITGGSSQNLSNLKFLSLKNNHLGQVNVSSFKGLQHIIEIHLSRSYIRSVGSRTFDNFKSLKRLFLNENNLEGLPMGIFDEIMRRVDATIDVTGNPFICDCGMKQLQIYLDDPTVRHKFAQPITCTLPLQCFEDFVDDCNICATRVTPTNPTLSTISPLSPSYNDTYPTTGKPPPGKPDPHEDVTCFNKASFIMLMVMSLLFSASVGAVILYCGIRHCPVLIKRAKFSLTPKKCTNIEPVVYASAATATPRSSTCKPPFLRSLSDTSIGSGRSYVSAINTPHFRTISWRMDKSNYMYENSIYLEDNMLDRPPPLPPHPRRNSSLTTNATSTRNYSANENIYELYE